MNSAVIDKTKNAATKTFAVISVIAMEAMAAILDAFKHPREAAQAAAKYLLIFLLGMLAAVIMFRDKDAKSRVSVQTTVETPAVVEAEAAQAVSAAEETEAIAQAAIERQAQYMARVLYGTARYHSRATQEAVCWCIINRVESTLFPNTIEEVCSQTAQWVGYKSSNPVTRELYDVAMETIETWQDHGIRMIPQDYLYFSWSEDEIVLRTSFNETARTHYWHVTE